MAPGQIPTASGSRAPSIQPFHLNPEAITKNVPGLTQSINSRLRLLYISCGLDDGLITSNKEFEDWLTEHKIPFTPR